MLNANALIKVLKEEHTLRLRHCLLLEAQGRALLACDREQFAALETQHAALLAPLGAHEAKRRAALTDETGAVQTVTQMLEALPDGGARRTLASLRDMLRATLEQARLLAARNEMLIQNELNYLAFTLDLFVEAGRSAGSGYGGSHAASGRLGLDRRA